jgi:hypothetical protein
MVGVVGIPGSTATDWGVPVAAVVLALAATCAVSEHEPTATKVTLRPREVQIDGEFEVTDFVPVPVVATLAVNVPPTEAIEGRFEMLGVVEVVTAPAAAGIAAVASVRTLIAVRSRRGRGRKSECTARPLPRG